MQIINTVIGFLILGLGISLNAGVSTSGSGDGVTFYLNLLPHRQTGQSLEQYDGVREHVLKGIADEVTLKFAPIKRSRKSFLSNSNSCLFPTNQRAIEAGLNNSKLNFVSSLPFDIVSFRLYTANKSLKHSSVDDFKASRIGYIRGTAALALLSKNASNFIPVSSEKQLIKMLELNRFDAFLGHHPDTDLALDSFNKTGSLFASPTALKGLRFPISIVCHKTEKLEEMINQLNPIIIDMHKTGLLREILGNHADLPDLKNILKSTPASRNSITD